MKNSFLKNKSIKSFLDFFSRVSISAIFISAIPGKINDFERTVEYISSKGIPEPKIRHIIAPTRRIDEIGSGIPFEEIYSTVLSKSFILPGIADINIAEIDNLEKKSKKRFDTFIFQKKFFHNLIIRNKFYAFDKYFIISKYL